MKNLFKLFCFVLCLVLASSGLHAQGRFQPISPYKPGVEFKGLRIPGNGGILIVPAVNALPTYPVTYSGDSTRGAVVFRITDNTFHGWTGSTWSCLNCAGTGGDTSIYYAVVDSTDVPFSQMVFAGNNQLVGTQYLVYDSLNHKVWIRNKPLTAGPRLQVDGSVQVYGLTNKWQTVLEDVPASSDTATGKPLYITPSGVIQQLNHWPVGIGGSGGGISQVVASYGLLNVNDSTLKADSTELVNHSRLTNYIAAVNAGIALKLNLSDTASMLTNYRHWTQGYLKAADIAGKVNYTDTTSMLTNYVYGIVGENYIAKTGHYITANPVNLSGTNVTSTLPHGKGGTGISSYTTGDIIYYNGSALAKLAIGATNQALRVSGGVPVWRDTAVITAGASIDSVAVHRNSATKSLWSVGAGLGPNAPNQRQIALGDSALLNNTSPSTYGYGGNIALGWGALRNLNGTADTNNIAIGTNTATGPGWSGLGNNTIVGSNTAKGTWSTGGSFNTVIGAGAMNGNVSGSFLLAMGFGSMNGNVSGNNSVGIGYLSLNGLTSGNDNVGIGQGALQQQAAASNGVGIGTYSLRYSTNSNSVGIGYQAGSMYSGSSNAVFVGANAAFQNASVSCNGCVIVGADAGKNFTGTRTYNNMIGYNISAPTAGGDNQFVVGANAVRYIVSDLTGTSSTRRTVISGQSADITSTNPSAALYIPSTTGFLYCPQMTGAEAEAVNSNSPADGGIFYCTNGNGSTVNSVGFWGRSAGAFVKFH